MTTKENSMPASRRATVTKTAGSRATVSNYGQTKRKKAKKSKRSYGS